MVGINGIGGIPEPLPDRPANVRDRKREVENASVREDGVQISSEAREAASSARLASLVRGGDEVRAEQVAAAKERIERGDFKLPEVVAEVARRLSKYLT
ncbi:MAG TPA: flagellar biosynthesis anti-sigma factor FlgM [Candidatus Hydrogenedentes bacterium]|jgi:anti-sigma28 factor (negative regulator of flagellin synthesis)|nr:flagellar biosynthesis anti-sigma factor FlgM [Candidatus Hydrogenedentota bacterium]HPJ98347.1 flagellar biosynthesis anti-sigma factor FlgM [Candidatus Hydrogenedentota bacterium]